MIDLSDRTNCFYWQTDRELTPEDYAEIFLKRHEVPTDTLKNIIRKGLTTLGEISSVEIDDPDENVVKGNVNIVRKIKLNGKPYVVRMHPAGVKNGYFYSEKMVLDLAYMHIIPVPIVIEVHEATSPQDMDFMLMTLSEGTTMAVVLEKDNSNEDELLIDCGHKMAQIHEIMVDGYGPFDNQQAKAGKLVGLHSSYHDFVHAGLAENIDRLIKYEVITEQQADHFRMVFEDKNFEPVDGPRLVHNDFADWNLLTDGHQISAVLDWDESHAGDPVADLACWSTFFTIERMVKFMEGYKQVGTLPNDYDERFHFYRLRYTISKMALRIKRYMVDKSPGLLERLENGKRALVEELSWFGI
ncbi:MAG: phosphotransferase [bacterium]